MSNIGDYEKNISDTSIMEAMHLPKGGSEIRSFHQIRKQVTSWYLSSNEIMPSQSLPTNPSIVTYRSKIYPYHGLHRSFLTTKTPSIRVKKEFSNGYKIRFCDDLFINMINNFRLVFNGVQLQEGEKTSTQIVLRTSREWENMKTDIGMTPCLTVRSDYLPATPLSIYLPWCYSVDKSDYFPLQVCGERDSLEHIIDFELSLEKLVIITDNEGNIVEYDPDILEVESDMVTIPVPQLIGLYTTLTNHECKHSICVSSMPDYFVKRYHYMESDIVQSPLDKIQIKFDEKNNIAATSVYWGARNMTTLPEKKNNTFVLPDGESVVEKTSLFGSVGSLFRDTDSYMTERAHHTMKKERKELGISKWENNILINEDPRKFSPAVNLKGGRIEIKLIYNLKDKYKCFCLINNIARFRFIKYPKTQEERLQTGAVIEEIN